MGPDTNMNGNGNTPAAIYLRRSTDRQEKSLEDQKREILRYASEHNFGIVAEFVDDGVSGTSGDTRKGFLAMLDEAKSPKREWQSILVWDIKRFGRMSSDEVGYYRWLFKQAGVEIIYTSEGFTGTSADKYLRFFKQEAARDESATLSKAVIRGLVSLADQGWWPGGMAPYGYDLAYFDQAGRLFQTVRSTGARDKVILDPDGREIRTVRRGQKVKGSHAEHVRLLPGLDERVGVVRRIFDWYAGSSSLGFRAIADRLNRQGVVSPRGRGWALSSIRVILMNPVYVGRVVWNRRSMGKFHRIADRREVERDGCGKRRVEWNAPEDWLVFENAHEPLVERDVFERAQRIMKERGDRAHAVGFLTGKGKTSRYLLSGLMRCGACGGAMHGRTTWKGKRRNDGTRVGTSYYVCGAAITKGKAICQPIQFLQKPLDEFVMDLVGKRMAAFLGENGRVMLRRLVERELATEVEDPGPEMRELRAHLDALNTKIDSVIDLAASSPENKDLLTDRLGRLRKEKREIERRLSELAEVPTRTIDPETVVDTILDGLKDAGRLFEHGTMEERKRVIRAFVEGLTLDGASQSAELRIKRLPEPDPAGAGSSFDMVAGAGFEPATFGL
jgi:DNA invertase Pin-like site-specific DNA recombinase